MSAFICTTCGTMYPASNAPPDNCPICLDDRQFVPDTGQSWTTLNDLQRTHRNLIREEEPNLFGICTEPQFAIGQRALLVRTPAGNVLWDCISLIDNPTISKIRDLGGVDAIAVSHPHFYSSMAAWSRAFDDAPIYIHAEDASWIQNPSDAIQLWNCQSLKLNDFIQLIHLPGHFPGYQVLHWSPTTDKMGALLAGDQPHVCIDRQWVSFMHSYPNLIPLRATTVRAIADTLATLPFDRIYGAWPQRVVRTGAKTVVARSAERYIQAITD
jgi:hypothetical protein